ncbi:DNA primase [Gammaproteobacteria bacterium]
MPGKIPQEFISSLVDRTDIFALIDSRIPLKRSGRGFTARCPFHEEKTPSFSVNPEKQTYHCFGCGSHGTAISFLMAYDRLSFLEAVESLARSIGVEVPREDGSVPISNNFYPVLEKVSSTYHEALLSSPSAQFAREYLKGRGVNLQSIIKFQIGYAPVGDFLVKSLSRKVIEPLLEVGVLINSQNRIRDRFSNRVVFPMRDRRGRVLGFGARAIGNEHPKYLNSPESSIFHKGNEIYSHWDHHGRQERVLVVEGYLDVISLEQYGIQGAVATLGTSVSKTQLDKISRLANQVVFCFDGDKAGKEAAWKTLNIVMPVLSSDFEVKFLTLPTGEDPDSLIRKEGTEQFEKRIENAISATQFLLREVMTRVESLSRVDRSAKILEMVAPFLDRMPTGGYKSALASEIAGIARVPIESVQSKTPVVKNEPALPRHAPLSIVETTIALLLAKPNLAKTVNNPSQYLNMSVPLANLFGTLLEFLVHHKDAILATILECWRGHDQYSHLERLACYQFEIPEECLENEFLDAVQRIEVLERKELIARLIDKERISGLSGEERKKLRDLLKTLHEATSSNTKMF